MVGALDTVPSIRPVLCLHETVCAGAADGFARMASRPACTLLHLGPGLANATAALHNARRARTAVVNLVGDMAGWHADADAPLAMDIEELSCAVSGFARTSQSAAMLERDAADAVAATLAPHGAHASAVGASLRRPCRVQSLSSLTLANAATLVVPHDATWAKAPRRSDAELAASAARALAEARGHAATGSAPLGSPAAAAFMADCAAALRAAPPGTVALLLGGDALLSDNGALSAAAAVSAALRGAPLLCANNFARVDRGAGVPSVTRLPYFPRDAAKALAPFKTLVLVDAQLPVAMFGYEGGVSRVCTLTDDAIWELDAADAAGALRALATALGASSADAAPVTPAPAVPPSASPATALTAGLMCAAVAAAQPAGAIIVDESLTSGTEYWALSQSSPPFSHLTLTGGAIGFGPPAALGAAVACPGRRVINLQADGSAMYSLQALWSQARVQADVITVICANQRYAILKLELALQRVPVTAPAPGLAASDAAGSSASRSLTDLGSPALDWTALARGMGVPASRVATVGELQAALREALARRGPTLIEAMLA